MCSRAGKLAWGVLGSNACPAGSYRITDAAQCRAAAATAGKGYWDKQNYWSDRPAGCQWDTLGDVILNTHRTGRANPTKQPLCAVPATGLCARVKEYCTYCTLRRAHTDTRAVTHAPSEADTHVR